MPLAQAPSVVAPVGRPASLAVEVLAGAAWFGRLLDDLGIASSVTLASYTYDEPAIQAILERRLRSNACEV